MPCMIENLAYCNINVGLFLLGIISCLLHNTNPEDLIPFYGLKERDQEDLVEEQQEDMSLSCLVFGHNYNNISDMRSTGLHHRAATKL